MIDKEPAYLQLQPGEKAISNRKCYQWPEYWQGRFVDTKPSSYAKWLIPKNKASIFQEDITTDLTNLGEIQQAEKELDKNVLEIKALIKKVGNLSKNFI